MAAQPTASYPDETVKRFSMAINHLGINLYKELAKTRQNIFFSPLSLSSALAIIFCGSSSETADELREVLGYAHANIGNDEVKSYFPLLLSNLDRLKSFYTLTSSNVVLHDHKFTVKDEFKELVKNSFRAMIVRADFRQEASKAIAMINEWIKDKTNGMIPQLLNSLDPNTAMIVLNAIYFKGFWLEKFNKNKTYPQNFYNRGLESQVKKVDMMHLKQTFRYGYKETFQAVQLPYKGNELVMLILLPEERNGIGNLEKNMSAKFLLDLKSKMWDNEVGVALPKFRLEYSESLKNSFQNLGLKQIFSIGANLSVINDSEDLLVSDIVHKAVLEVNEEGSEAAVATRIDVDRVCDYPDFIVDHPFIFVILNCKTDMILFMGKVEEL